MFKCVKTYGVEYAHQLYSSYTKLCHETIHGHSGKVSIEFSGTLNADQMVIDFGKVSDIIKKHIMKKYDHALFMPNMFPKRYLNSLKNFNKRLTITTCNPTAEKFAEWIFDECNEILKKNEIFDVTVTKVEFWETETGKAEYSSDVTCDV